MRHALLLLPLLLLPTFAVATPPPAVEACDAPPRYGVEATAAALVRAACREHRLWLRPFIDTDGRLAALAVTEAERAPLDDGSTPAWQRVVRYWRDSGTLQPMIAAGTPGAASCLAAPGTRASDSDCRAFVLDHPWSAAFVSWVAVQARTPGFLASARHLDYIARAWRHPQASPWTYEDPLAGKPGPGDLLCFLRAGDQGLGAQGLRAALATQSPLPSRSHCEVVVAANPGGDRTLYLIGGNVLNAVVMRKLPLDRSGRLVPESVLSAAAPPSMAAPVVAHGTAGGAPSTEDAGTPSAAAPAAAGPPVDATVAADAGPVALQSATEDTAPAFDAASCSPAQAGGCSFNRRDWAVLLKLRPQAQLDALPPAIGAPAAAPPLLPPAAGAPLPAPATR